MTYETGIVVSLLISAYFFLVNVFTRSSVHHENMKRAGYRKSWWTGNYKRKNEGSAFLELVGVFVGGALWSLLSWVNVAGSVAYWIYAKAKDADAPVTVRELRWRLRNIPMSLPELIEVERGLAEATRGRALTEEEKSEVATAFAERTGVPDMAQFFHPATVAAQEVPSGSSPS